MKQFFGNKYVKGLTQFIQQEHFGTLDFIDYHCQLMGISREEYMAGYRTATDMRLAENKEKPGPDPYMTGLDDETEEEKEERMKKQAKMDDDDPDAYKPLPGDKEAREKGKVKKSKFTKKYHELYGEDKETDEAVVLEKSKILKFRDYGIDNHLDLKQLIEYLRDEDINWNQRKQSLKFDSVEDADKAREWLGEAFLNEDDDDKKSTDRGPIDDEKIETALKNKSEETGVPIGILRAVMRRGMAAWKTGHRPGATQQQWGYARVNSFLTKGEGTWGKADKDLAKEVRDGGHDKKLKKG
jgi:hypothetical protein